MCRIKYGLGLIYHREPTLHSIKNICTEIDANEWKAQISKKLKNTLRNLKKASLLEN